VLIEAVAGVSVLEIHKDQLRPDTRLVLESDAGGVVLSSGKVDLPAVLRRGGDKPLELAMSADPANPVMKVDGQESARARGLWIDLCVRQKDPIVRLKLTNLTYATAKFVQGDADVAAMDQPNPVAGRAFNPPPPGAGGNGSLDRAKRAVFELRIKGPDGKMVRWSNIGGQPFVLTTWTTDAQIKEAVEFVKWWLSSGIQHQFSAAGGQSAVKSVYSDPKYVTYRPWNRTWAPSLDWQNDVWHVPQFFELLTQQQDQFDRAITGKQNAKTTLDNIAKFQQNLLSEAGLIK